MHEMGIAGSILDAVRAEMLRHGAQRASKVGVRIGSLAGVDAASLSFCFEVMVKDSELGALALEIEPAAADELYVSYLEVEDE